MPCDQIRTTTVDLGKVNVHRLADAMKARGWKVANLTEHSFTATKDGVSTRFADGRFTTQTAYGQRDPLQGEELTEVRKEYQRQVITYAAAKAGAAFRWTNAERTEGEIIKNALTFGFGSNRS